MTKRIKNLLAASLIAIVAVFMVLGVAGIDTAAALDPGAAVQDGVEKAGGGEGGEGQLQRSIKVVINLLLFLIGAVAVIMIIIGGIRYTLSNGDSSQITGAKNTVLYSVIGLVVALLAYAIVNFVVAQF